MDRIADIWGTRTPFDRGERWPVRVDTALADGVAAADVDRWVPSACVLCSNVDNSARLTEPLNRRGGRLEPAVTGNR